jgi:hypothetical protein
MFFQYTDRSIYPTVIISMSHKNKKWTHKIKNVSFKLNVAIPTVFKNQQVKEEFYLLGYNAV